jgi:hypothetical protein
MLLTELILLYFRVTKPWSTFGTAYVPYTSSYNMQKRGLKTFIILFHISHPPFLIPNLFHVWNCFLNFPFLERVAGWLDNIDSDITDLRCSTKILFLLLPKILTAVKDKLQIYSATTRISSGVNQKWILV